MSIDTNPNADSKPSRYLQGNYAPVFEELDEADLEVIGHIPEALTGAYLRNGPNQQFTPLGRYHVFDGDGMIHAVSLDGGRARYHNRFVESRGLLAERRAGHALYGGLSEFTFPDQAVIDEGGMMKNTANTNVIRHAGRILALMEGAPPTELSTELDTLGEYNFDGQLAGAMTAHPKWDPETGELLFFGYSPFPPYLRFHVADASGRLIRNVDVTLPRSVMMHDFTVTRDHVVFFDLPAVFDFDAMMHGGTSITWQPQHGSRIGVLPRDASQDDVTWFELDPFFVFHFLNSWDDGDTIVIDGCRAPRMPVAFGDEVLTAAAHPTLHRWTVNLKLGSVTESQLDDRPGDFPRVNHHRSGLANQYGYVAAGPWTVDDVQFKSVIKYDLQAGTSQIHHYGGGGEHIECGEAVFAPDPAGTAEDDGWLINFVTDRATEISELVIVDARDVEGDAVARILMPQRVPTGFHGNWMPDQQY
ncbi:MAG: carotenoid oxygenase family protein [Actinomycetes bacterium]